MVANRACFHAPHFSTNKNKETELKERFIDWMLHRYKSIEQVYGIWVPSKYVEDVRGLVFAIIWTAIIVAVSVIFIL